MNMSNGKNPLFAESDGSWNEEDRNARAYGFEIGRGAPLAMYVLAVSSDNPFLDPNWRENIKEEPRKDYTPAKQCKHVNRMTFNTWPPHIKCIDCGSLLESMDKKEQP